MLRLIKQAKNLKGKRVLVRVDFNVPLKNNKVTDDSRIRASLLTINFLRKKGARVILVTHLGRPEGKVNEAYSLKPIAKILPKLLAGPKEKTVKVKLLNFDDSTKIALEKMKDGEVVMLENIRFHKGEERNDEKFAKKLASLADIFVLDGFAVAHREAASVSGVQAFLPSYAGFLLQKEITELDNLMKKAPSPFLAVIGGAKIETKLPVIKNLLKIADYILLGGAIINVYYKAKGYSVGASLSDKGFEKIALSLFAKKKIIMPLDVMVGTKEGDTLRVVNILKKPHQICRPGEAILDIGPATSALYANYIKIAQTVVWNGAMGYFENRSYALGTYTVADALAQNKKAFSVIGGGETIEAMNNLGLLKDVKFVSTGGGAMLEYLGGIKLPGLKKLS